MVSASIPWVRTWLTDSATVSLIMIMLPTCIPVSDFRVEMLADGNDVGSARDSSPVPGVPTLLSFVGVWATSDLTKVCRSAFSVDGPGLGATACRGSLFDTGAIDVVGAAPVGIGMSTLPTPPSSG